MLEFTKPASLHGDALEDEIRAAGWPDAEVSVAGDVLRVAEVPDGDRDSVKTVIDNHVPPDPPPDPDAELASAIEGASTLAELKDALLGNLSQGRVAGRPSN